jgi:hypothetical protein
MIMWIAAIVLVALTVSIGYRQGAIRAAVSFVGLIIAAFLAMPLAPMFNFIFGFVKVHPVVAEFLKPLIAFILVSVVFKAVGAFLFRKVDYHYRYHVPDAQRAFWERMHRRVGASVGALNGVVYFFVFALLIYVSGYFAIQTGGDESGSKVLSFIADSAKSMKDTGMDKVIAPFDPAPKKYHEVSDLLGMLYHNRGLRERLYNYPVFATMSERPLFKDMGADKGLQNMIEGGTKLSDLLENAKVQEVVTNQEIYTELMEIDRADLRAYLETGVAPKFADEKILGRWAYDFHSTLQANKRGKTDIGASTWSRLAKELEQRMKDSRLTTYHDNKAVLELSPAMEGKASPKVARGVLRSGQTNFVNLWLDADPSYSATGKWSGANPNYLISLGNQKGTKTSEARIANNRIAFKFEEKDLVFERIPD